MECLCFNRHSALCAGKPVQSCRLASACSARQELHIVNNSRSPQLEEWAGLNMRMVVSARRKRTCWPGSQTAMPGCSLHINGCPWRPGPALYGISPTETEETGESLRRGHELMCKTGLASSQLPQFVCQGLRRLPPGGLPATPQSKPTRKNLSSLTQPPRAPPWDPSFFPTQLEKIAWKA